MKLIEALTHALHDAGSYNKETVVKPACILWTDPESQFISILPRLREELPELLICGQYDPRNRTGPAIWLRLALADQAPGHETPQGRIPILYLPGISRQTLRNAGKCPDELKPLVEVQYRGALWTQLNGKDWTVYAFFKSPDNGALGFDVTSDAETQGLLRNGLPRLLDEDIQKHRGKKINQEYLSDLFTGEDPVKTLLHFLNSPESFKEMASGVVWQGFVNSSKKKYAFDPDNDGVLSGAEKLNRQEGSWLHVWNRFREAPSSYPGVLQTLRSLSPPDDLFGDKRDWAQWNQKEEETLQKTLDKLVSSEAKESLKKIPELEAAHGPRRDSVWAELGEAPLSNVLQPLNSICEEVSKYGTPNTLQEVSDAYSTSGWQVDAAAIHAMQLAEESEDTDLVFGILARIYQPWLDDQASTLQNIIGNEGYTPSYSDDPDEGSCVLFVDGLRMDLAQRILVELNQKGYGTTFTPQWSALPTLTATAKPAISPVRDAFTGNEVTENFEPQAKSSAKSLAGGYHFKKAMEQTGYNLLTTNEFGSGKGRAWCEIGQFDHYGHEMGWKLVTQLDKEFKDLHAIIGMLFLNGWKRIRIVTDHGWLLLPGGLPKVDLPSAYSANKWGRCALIKAGADSGENLFHWHWNQTSTFASARGVACYAKGYEYAHGGISPQECLTLNIEVTPGDAGPKPEGIKVEYSKWKGLRCHVVLSGGGQDILADIRIKPAKDDQITTGAKSPDENGSLSILVTDEELEGKEAFIVVLDAGGKLLTQMKTMIGGNDDD